MTGVSKAEFQAVMSAFASGVTVVTTVDGAGRPAGLTVSAFSSLSLDPPLCLVCIDRRSPALAAVQASRRFAVNILGDGQQDLSVRFSSRVEDRFADIAWQAGPATGCPVLPDALAWMECELTGVCAGGDHDILLGLLVGTKRNEGKPLVYWNRGYADLAVRPKG